MNFYNAPLFFFLLHELHRLYILLLGFLKDRSKKFVGKVVLINWASLPAEGALSVL